MTKNPDDVIKELTEYSLSVNYVGNRKEELDKSLSDAERNFKERVRELDKTIDEKDSELDNVSRRIFKGNADLKKILERKEQTEQQINDRVREFNGYAGFIEVAMEKRNEIEARIKKLLSEERAMKGQIDLARALVSEIKSPKGKAGQILKQLLEVVRENENSDLSALDEFPSRDIVINALIQITKDGIAGIENLNSISFITRKRYDQLTALERERVDIAREREELDNIRSSYGKEVGMFVEDYIKGKTPSYPAFGAYLKSIIDTKIEENVRSMFRLSDLVTLLKDQYMENEPFLFILGATSTSRLVLARVSPHEFAESIHKGDRVVHGTDKKGNSVDINICSALMQLFEQIVYGNFTDLLRKEWKEILSSEAAKKGTDV